MTVKSPFYNKPSTSTSVDSCHKCPFISTNSPQDSNVPSTDSAPVSSQAQQVQSLSPSSPPPSSSSTTGFDHQLSETSNNVNITSSSTNDRDAQGVEPCSSRATTSDSGTTSLTCCSNCKITSSPLWRRSPMGEVICNACGLYLKARNTTRPPWLKRNSTKRPVPLAPVQLAPAPPVTPAPIAMKIPIRPTPLPPVTPITISSSSSAPSTPPSLCDSTDDNSSVDSDCSDSRSMMTCFNCKTTSTPLWRRDDQGNTICNACGLYYKLHHVHRPIAMKRSIIKRRKRVAIPATMSTTTNATISSTDDMTSSTTSNNKRKSSVDHHHQQQPSSSPPLKKRLEWLPLLAAKATTPGTVVLPNVATMTAEQSSSINHHHHPLLPSPPLHPTKSSSSSSCNLASLLNPSNNEPTLNKHRLPPISLPSPPMIAHDTMHQHHHHRLPSPPPPPTQESPVAAAAAAAFATVSALLDPKANRQHTHQMLKAHRHELQREVSNLTSMLTRTTAMLENLDQVMYVTGSSNNNDNTTTTTTTNSNVHVLQSILALSKSS